MILNLLIVLGFYGMLLAISEIALNRGLPARYTRKIVHIGAGLIAFMLPRFMDLKTALILGVILAVFIFWTDRQHLFDSIHKVSERTHGALFFPLGLMVCAGMFWNTDPFIFQISALILGLSDGLAGIVGHRYGQSHYSVTGQKTIIGSLAFFAVTLIILLLAAVYRSQLDGSAIVGIMFLSALVLTAVEGLLGKGWDNLILPPVAGSVLYLINLAA